MSDLVADQIVERLHSWGVTRVFGYPGDGITGLIGAFDRASERVDFIQVRHEETAALMACGHAKFTGDVGVCVATSGPGAIHLLNGLYDAKLDHQPVVALVGQQPLAALGSNFLQEVDLVSLFKDVAGDFVQMASDPGQVRHLVDRAFRIAKANRTVTCVILPNDVQRMDAVEMPEQEHGSVHSSRAFSVPSVVPLEADLRAAAEILNAGEKVAILIGAGALGASDQVVEVADKLCAGVAKALLGKAALRDDLPFVTGAIGLLGTKPSWDLMKGCDTLLMIGTRFPYAEFLPDIGQARAVQIDLDPTMVAIRYPTEVNLIGDAAATLEQLMPLLDGKRDRTWGEKVESSVSEWWTTLEERAAMDADPVNPQKVFWELSSRLPDDCVITADSGSVANWYARDIKIRPGMLASLSGTLATMGCGLPYALAAKYAHPGRPVVALIGDGAMQMNGINELITLKKYCERWSDPRFIVLVLNNRDLNEVTWEQRAVEGDPRFEGSQSLPDFPYAEYARLIGLGGLRVDDPSEVGAAWDTAFANDRPFVLEVVTDPNVPPLPPHIDLHQANQFMKAIWRGDSQKTGILRQSLKETFRDLVPRGPSEGP
ncbi:MAG: thiamine pyrophosphate-requiring protein [Actinomycetota bacterium]|nr:thiamine pyrophosphate-requiring protein [Actinomycetota bacterium]